MKRVDALRDEDIDYSDIPELDADFFRKARVLVPPRKQQLTIDAVREARPGSGRRRMNLYRETETPDDT